MKTSITFGSIALALAGVLATGQAFGETSRPLTRQAAHDNAVERETLRRAALAEHQKRYEDVERTCTKPDLSPAQLEACRTAYRRL